jgi:hypothetical protein
MGKDLKVRERVQAAQQAKLKAERAKIEHDKQVAWREAEELQAKATSTSHFLS